MVDAPEDPAQGVGLGDVSVGLPGASDSHDAVVRGGISIYTNDTTNTAVAVNPTTDGAQILTSIGGPESPTSYAYPIKGAATITIEEDGSATAYGAGGEPVLVVAAPWAFDANGIAVPTHYSASGNTLSQVVEHSTAAISYPVLPRS